MDIGSFIQSISVASAIVGTLGLTSLGISVYERYSIRKENRRERVTKLVLTPEFFSFFSEFWKLFELFSTADVLRANGAAVIFTDERMLRLTDTASLNAEIEKAKVRLGQSFDKARNSGPLFLASSEIRNKIFEAWDFVNWVIPKDANDYPSKQFVEEYLSKLHQVASAVRKEVGLE